LNFGGSSGVEFAVQGTLLTDGVLDECQIGGQKGIEFGEDAVEGAERAEGHGWARFVPHCADGTTSEPHAGNDFVDLGGRYAIVRATFETGDAPIGLFGGGNEERCKAIINGCEGEIISYVDVREVGAFEVSGDF
jgi:hypothetical protein